MSAMKKTAAVSPHLFRSCFQYQFPLNFPAEIRFSKSLNAPGTPAGSFHSGTYPNWGTVDEGRFRMEFHSAWAGAGISYCFHCTGRLYTHSRRRCTGHQPDQRGQYRPRLRCTYPARRRLSRSGYHTGCQVDSVGSHTVPPRRTTSPGYTDCRRSRGHPRGSRDP